MSYPRVCPACGHELVEEHPLTNKESALLEALQWVEWKPTYAELAEIMGWRSQSTVHEYMHKLARKGYLRFDKSLCDQKGPGLGWELVE